VLYTSNRRELVTLEKNEIRFMTLNFWGNQWYRELDLPNIDEGFIYVVKVVIGKYTDSKMTKVNINVPIFGLELLVDNMIYQDFLTYKKMKSGFILVDKELIKLYPAIAEGYYVVY
jgi:hypothetical protein